MYVCDCDYARINAKPRDYLYHVCVRYVCYK